MIHIKRKRRPIAEINVVPYIDVMLVLLVIFMITAPLLMQGVNVNLPQTNAKLLPPKEQMPIVVSIDSSGHYYLNISEHPEQRLTPLQLMTEVAARLKIAKEKHEEKHIYVKGDRDVDYGKVIKAMVLLQKAGAHDVGLVTEPST